MPSVIKEMQTESTAKHPPYPQEYPEPNSLVSGEHVEKSEPPYIAGRNVNHTNTLENILQCLNQLRVITAMLHMSTQKTYT